MPKRIAFLLSAIVALGALALLLLSSPPSGPRYRITDLQIGASRVADQVADLNERGEVVGGMAVPLPVESATPSEGGRRRSYVTHPFLWTRESGMRDLGLLEGNSGSARDIDERGRILVLEHHQDLSPSAVQPYGGPGGYGSPRRQPIRRAYVIHSATSAHIILTETRANSLGQVALGPKETLLMSASGLILPGTPMEGLLRWSAEKGYEPLGSLGGGEVYPNAVNDSGLAAGFAFAATGQHAFLWTPDRGMRDIHKGDFGVSFARGLNNHGQVVGDFWGKYGQSDLCPFLWDSGTFSALPMDPFEECEAKDINDHGEIVGGGSYRPVTLRILTTLMQRPWAAWAVRWLEDWIEEKVRAILWKDGVLYDLNNHLVDGKGWVLWSARHINNKGQIVGEGTFKGNRRSFLLDPAE